MSTRGNLFFVVGVLVALVALVFAAAGARAVLINEFVVDPQSDWDGDGGIDSGDEWIELYNPSINSINLDGWKLNLIDSSNASQALQGFIAPQDYVIILNPNGSQSNDGRIELVDSVGNLVDAVSYGNYGDGDILDNAVDGNAIALYDECLARYPNGVDTNHDNDDFVKMFCTYDAENNFTYVPIDLNVLPAQPNCILESDDVVLSANVAGSIDRVELLLNSKGYWERINLSSSGEVYSYAVNSSRLVGNSTLLWQFSVFDVYGNETLSDLHSANVGSLTKLNVFPSSPDGENGWYISQPLFELVNPDADNIYYRWTGGYLSYAGVFGLESAPNNGNITGGMHSLFYFSDLCDEDEQEFLGRFDFSNPVIGQIYPESNSKVYEDGAILIEARVDEIYQGNSGVDLNSVEMKVDGDVVPAVVEQSGLLDAKVRYLTNLSDGKHSVDVYASDKSGRNSSLSWNFDFANVGNFALAVNAPSEGIYFDRRVQFNVTTSRAAEISYINWNDLHPAYKVLCRDCEGFGYDKERFKKINEGQNTLNFRALDDFGNVDEEEVFLIVDSKDPRIASVSPKSGFSSGDFEVDFIEDNPWNLKIVYGNNDEGFREDEINISDKCMKNGQYKCHFDVDLGDYNGERIDYFVVLEDIAGNSEQSKVRTLDVDFSLPKINDLDFEVNGKFVSFYLDLDEAYFDKVTYLDNSDNNPKEKVLCRELQDGICSETVSFGEGEHEVEIVVYDKAGNSVSQVVEFFTDSRVPKIKSTEPKKGFASGEFQVTFEEANPQSLFIEYGNLGDKRASELNLSSCWDEKKNKVCSISLDLSDFEEQEISYLFNLTDAVGNYAISNARELKVDTLPPNVSSFSYSANGRDVTFSIGITDANFDEVVYQDRADSSPRFVRLCSNLEDGFCEAKKKFKFGNHVVDIVAKDEAGNEVVVANGLEFSV